MECYEEMTPAQIDTKIKESKQKTQDLIEAKENLLNMTDVQRIATLIHKCTCHWNHTDGCGWYYESWEGYSVGGCRSGYSEKANKLLKTGVSAKDIITVLNNMGSK